MLLFNIVVVTAVYWSTLTLSEADCPENWYCATYGGLTTVPDDILPQVSQIHLQDNQISSIRPGAFINNTKCTTLRLEFNKLTVITRKMWEGLGALRYLYLGSNNITTIGERCFSNLPVLEGLYLENNQLNSLSEDIFHPDHPQRLELMLFGNQFKEGDPGLCWIQTGKTEGWITRSSRLTPIIESLACSQTAKPEVHNSTGSTTGSDIFPGSGSSRSVTEEMTVKETVTEEFNSPHPSGEPAMQPLQPETKETTEQLKKTSWIFVIAGGVALCFVSIVIATACFLSRSKFPQLCKKAQQTSVVEIELHPLPIEDRPAPALPPHTEQSSTAHSSTSHPTTTHSSTAHPSTSSARESQGYLLPKDEPDSTAESASPETARCSGIYSYAYQHMVARIMAFRMLQRRGRLGATSAQIHRHRRQRPPARRPSSDPTSQFWNVQNSSGSTPDSSASIRDILSSNQQTSEPDSDYLEPLGTGTGTGTGNNDTRHGSYERIDDRDSEIVTMVTNV